MQWQIQEKNSNFTNAREELTFPRHFKSLLCVYLATGSLKNSAHRGSYSLPFSCPFTFIPTLNSIIFYIFLQSTLLIFIYTHLSFCGGLKHFVNAAASWAAAFERYLLATSLSGFILHLLLTA